MLSNAINIVKLPFINTTNTSIPNGTCYRIFYAQSQTTVLILQTGSSTVNLKGNLVYNGDNTGINEFNNVLIRYVAAIGDTVELLYYSNNWYVKGLFSTSSAPTVGNATDAPAISETAIEVDGATSNVDYTIVSNANKYIVGVCWNTPGSVSPTIESGTTYSALGAEEDGANTFSFTSDGYVDDDPVDVQGRVFALNSLGISYGSLIEFTLNPICLLRGTLVDLVDGKKAIEDITYDDNIRVWNFDEGSFDSAKPLWIKRVHLTNKYNKITFSDGTVLCTIGQHRIFNKESGSFTYPMTDQTPIGTTTYTVDGREITLVAKEHVNELVEYYNVITDRHINLFANTILTSCRYNNIYPIKHMKFQKDDRVIREYDASYGIPQKYYDGLRVGEQTIPLEETIKYVNRLINTERDGPRKVMFLDHQGVMYLDEYPPHKCIRSFNSEPTTVVQKLIEDDPGIDVVVSSDWKYRVSLPEMQLFYLSQGLRAPIDYTPGKHSGKPRIRAEEITEWLHSHKVDKWVAVDDLDMREFLKNFVWVNDINKGFDEKILQQVKHILA